MNNTRPDKDKVSDVFSSKRLATILLALLTFVIAVSLSWNIINQKNAALESARLRAKTVLEKDILFRRWNSLMGGVYAPVSGKTEPNPYLEGVVSERDLKTPSGRELTLVNPEFMTRQVLDLEEKSMGVLGHLTSLKPIRKENAADPWERKTLLAFEKGAKEVSSLEMINGREYMRLMRPLVTEEECLKCHERQGYRKGDIRGGLSVSVLMEPHWEAFSRSAKELFFWHIFLWLCAAGVIYAGYRHQRRAEEYQKEAEEELRVLLSRQEAILTSVPDIITEVNNNKVYTWANNAGYEFFGKDVIGKKSAYYFEGEQQTYDVVQPLFSGSSDTIYVESWQRRRDGEKRLLSWWCRVLKDMEGNVAGALSTARDITEQKKTEEALRKSEEFNRNILESVDEGFIIIDRDYRIISANRAFADEVRMPVEKIIGEHCYEISHHCDAPCNEAGEICAVKEVFETGKPQTAVHTHYNSEGMQNYVETKAYPHSRDESGRVMTIIEILVDITEKKKLEEQLRHAQKMEAVGTLAGGIAHDFNNILNVIMGYSNMVRDRMEAGSLSREQMNEVLTAAERAANLTRGLLAFSRKQAVEVKPLNVNETILGIQKMLVRIIKENIDFKLNLTDRLLTVMADAGQIEQVLMNLAANAKDAMPEGGHLTITTGLQEIDDKYVAAYGYEKPGMYALITVTDTGQGMGAETQKKIFEPFFTTKGIGKGSGLGLAISYGIIKQHNGYIHVYSELGKGTTFKILLPVIEESAIKKREVEESVPANGGSETILIAEDDAAVRNLSRIVLESFGYTVITAADGEDAITRYRENIDDIRLVILDLVMPNKNGKEAYAEIKNMKPDAKAVFFSGYTMDTIHQKELLDEGMGYILKPFSPKDLLKKVREILDK